MAMVLNDDQAAALAAIRVFLLDDNMDAFILRGSAGSGKTTLVASICNVADELKLSYILLAPTGRAARILGHKVARARGVPLAGSTIHSVIYHLAEVEVNEHAEQANDPGVRLIFPLTESEPSHSLFVIDESSLVGDRRSEGDFMQFGSGRLLRDLITHARAGRPGRDGGAAKLLFVGDAAQLPPVGENASPALSEAYLRSEFGLRVGTAELTKVVRQAADSPILQRASDLREAIRDDCFNKFSLRPDGIDIEEIEAPRAIDLLEESIRSRTSIVAVVPSNATALEYNRAVRERLWGSADAPVRPGDTLLVNKNSRRHELSNGDLVKVLEVAPEAERVAVALAGKHLVELRFRKATVAYRAQDDVVIQVECLLLDNPLDSPLRELPPLEIQALLVNFRNRYPALKSGTAAFRRAIVDDPYFNALHVKYGYAMTCHKAQGGEWDSALVHFAPSGGKRNATFFRWAYTAITRAARKLIIVGAPNFTPVSGTVWNDPPPAQRDGQPDTTANPDEKSEAFSPSLAPLMVTHRQLRAAWEERSIRIENLEHLQYCERYTLAREYKRAVISYYYDKRHRVGRSLSVPGAFLDTGLASEALAVFPTLVEKAAGQAPSFIEDHLARIDKAISGSPIRRPAHREMPYRLRVTLTDGFRQGDIDFTYDDKKTWTTAHEVGGPGASHGLYEEVRGLMAAQEA